MKHYEVSWTYRHSLVDKAKLPIIYRELRYLWNFLREDTPVLKSRFYFAPFDEIFKRICKTLCVELRRLRLYEFCTGTGYFAIPPGKMTAIHVDQGYNYVLNFPVINCDNSYTVWYNDVEQVPVTPVNSYLDDDTILYKEHRTKEVEERLVPAPYIPYFKLDRKKEIDRVDSNQPLWINGSIPHRPEIQHLNFRLLATLRFTPLPRDIFLKNTGIDVEKLPEFSYDNFK